MTFTGPQAAGGRNPHGRRLAAWAALSALLLTVAPAAVRAAPYTWTGGGGADTSWSNPANWGGTGPSNNESSVSLTFPPLTGPYASHNDLTGLVVNFLEVTTQVGAGTYAFTGNPLTLIGPAPLNSPGTGTPNLEWRIPLVLGSDLTIVASGRRARLLGDIDLGSRMLTFNTGGDIAVEGVVSGAGSLRKTNTSALTLAAANTYTGATTIVGGALYLADASALGSAAAGTTVSGGFLGFAPASTITLAEPLTFTGGGITAYGTPTITAPVTLEATAAITAFEPATALTISGPIGGNGALDKRGPGALVLTGTASHDGATTVTAGALQLDGALTAAAGLTVQAGGLLRGDGTTAGPIAVESGGTLAPGTGPGRLSCTGLTMANGATLAIELDGPTAGTLHDQVAVAGPVLLDDPTLAATLGYTPASGQSFAIIAREGAGTLSGTFAGLPEGTTFTLDGAPFHISYAGDNVVLIAEPGSGTPTASPTGAATATPTATATSALPPPTATSTVPATASPTAAGSPSATPSHSPSPTPTATLAAPVCVGDCNGSGAVEINELVVGVNVALGNVAVDVCPAFDAGGDGSVAIQELIAAVNNALGGCD